MTTNILMTILASQKYKWNKENLVLSNDYNF